MNRASLFQQRLSIERKLIRCVNELDPEKSLAGLNSQNIKAWSEKMRASGIDLLVVAKIEKILLDVVVRLKLDADKSRVVFDDTDPLNEGMNANEEIAMLTDLVTLGASKA